MANHTTGAQRRNARMDKIFDKAKSEGRGLVGNSGIKGLGVNSPAMSKAKNKALKKAKKEVKTKNPSWKGVTNYIEASKDR